VLEDHLCSFDVWGNLRRHQLFGDYTQGGIAAEASGEHLDSIRETKRLYNLPHLLMVVIALDVEALRWSSTVYQTVIPRQDDFPSELCTPQEPRISEIRIIQHVNPHHSQPFRELPKHRIRNKLGAIRRDDLGI
jgi:hypothetical protein